MVLDTSSSRNDYQDMRCVHPPRAWSFALALSSLLALGLCPGAARACGGTFCDAPSPTTTVMPVDQTGEAVLFWTDQSGDQPWTEAHIQVSYEGEAERFAWIIPVTAVPEVLVGSQALFDNLLAATVPTFTITTSRYGDCSSSANVAELSLGCALRDSKIAGVDADDWDPDNDNSSSEPADAPPDILGRGFAGAFEYVTLSGDDIEQVSSWLDQAGFAQDDDALPILDAYLQEGFVFVAVKLRASAQAGVIHPLVIRYPGTEPCIPIRLTRIAATDDMAIRAMFLGQRRYAPQNWPHVELNWSRLDWADSPARAYAGLVGAAVDEAGGRAWVTEYADTDAIVRTEGIREAAWDVATFEGIDPTEVVERLMAQGLVHCTNFCDFLHPQIEALLRTYLPAPEGVSEDLFWSNLDDYEIDPVAWSAQPGFAAELDARIVGPGDHALVMLERATMLTRLYTLISPHEMLDDPLFHAVDGLGSVDSDVAVARFDHCGDGPSYYELPDGRALATTDWGAVPELDDNPTALEIQRVPMIGPPQVEVDNAERVDRAIDRWNRRQRLGPQPGCAVVRIEADALLLLAGLLGLGWLGAPRRRQA